MGHPLTSSLRNLVEAPIYGMRMADTANIESNPDGIVHTSEQSPLPREGMNSAQEREVGPITAR